MSKVYTHFQTKTGQKPFGTAQTYIAYIREYNPRGMIQVSLRAFLQFTHCCLASCVTCWSASSFSWRQVMQYGTPPYDHPVYKTTSLLRPYSFKPNVTTIDSVYYFEDPVNATTSLLRPGFYGPTVVVLTGFHWPPRYYGHILSNQK